ncbi:DUF6445 family protein [Sphingomonas sp. HMP6]|uniref:DUF6445 family protein n=1 Tax=Sphingomonas sp. HMP6 TaxID=1517551 RepID=UPI00159710C8|nr:DUF6445 family protein [Sphingomonas sp. HMP6]BCA59818.1 hypothetical protein Q27BB25_08405 [Sphingomonas sp. HMP6]
MLPALLIIDDFLADPHGVRRAALGLGYDPALKAGNYPGLLSNDPLEIKGLDAAVAARIGVPVAAMPGTSHGHCRLTLAGDKGASGVHIDPCFYSGILYLSLPEHARGGTDFFRHRPTGLDRVPTTDLALLESGFSDVNDLVERVVNADTLKPARWEKVMTVPMRFNRLVLFSPWLFHNSAPGFGRSGADGRLVMLLFFAQGRPSPDAPGW